MTAAPVPAPSGESKLLLRQVGEVDAGFLDHASQLAGRKDVVHVLIATIAHLRALALELLCCARHDGYRDNLRRSYAGALGVVGLGDSTQHLLRGLAGRQVRQQIRIEVFDELDPSGLQDVI